MATTLLVILLKVTLVLLIAMGLTRIMPRAAARTRHLVWLLAVAALVVVPAVSAWAPIEVPVLARAERPVETDRADRTDGTAGSANLPVSTALSVSTASSASAPSVLSALSVPVLLALAWLVIAAALLLRLLAGALAVRRIVRRAKPLDEATWLTPLYEIADRMGLDHAPRLLQSSDVQMPFAAGLAAPAVVLPAESESWSAGRRSAVLVHELGHVRRRDLIGHTLSRIVCAVYWFHPLVWTAARRLRAESEQACDDLALAYGARPSDYAEHLLDIVVCVRQHRTPSVALAMAHKREFEGRMLAILNPDRRRLGPGKARMMSFAGALAGVVLLVGAMKPAERRSTVDGQQSTVTDGGLIASPEGAKQSGGVNRQDPGVLPADTDTTVAIMKLGTRKVTSASPDTTVSFIKPGSRAADPQDPRRAEILTGILKSDTSAEARRLAAWGLESYAEESQTVTAALVTALGHDANASVREMAAWALASASPSNAVSSALVAAMRDGDRSVRATATWAVGNVGDRDAVPALTARLIDGDPVIRELAAWGIGNCSPKRAPAELMRALADSNSAVRTSVAWALYSIGDASAVNALDAALQKESDPDVQLAMIRALGNMGDAAVDALQRVLTSSHGELRATAVRALANGDASGPWPWPRPRPRPYP